MKVLDTSKHAKEATWHTRIDPWSTGYKCMGQIGICYNIDVVTTRHKDSRPAIQGKGGRHGFTGTIDR